MVAKTSATPAKKHLAVSMEKLSPELQEAVKAAYPAGFYDAMMRIDKPNGDFFYAVPFETDEISYLVKIDVKIDELSDDDDDKDMFGEDDTLTGADDIKSDDSDDDSADDVADDDSAEF